MINFRPPEPYKATFLSLTRTLSTADDRRRDRFALESHHVLCMWRDTQHVLDCEDTVDKYAKSQELVISYIARNICSIAGRLRSEARLPIVW